MLLFLLSFFRLEDFFNTEPITPLDQVAQLMSMNRYREALTMINKIMAQEKDDPPFLRLLRATCDIQVRNSKECISDCTYVIRHKASNSSEVRTALSLRSRAQLQLGNFDAAEKDAKSANDRKLLKWVDDARRLLKLGQMQFDNGQIEEAKKSLDELMRTTETADSVILLRAEIAWMEGDTVTFAKLAKAVAESFPKDAKLHYRRGVLQLCGNDIAVAKASLQKSARQPKAPENATRALDALNEIVEQQGKFQGFLAVQNVEFAGVALNRTQSALEQFCERGSPLGQTVMLMEYRLARLKGGNETELLAMLDRMIEIAPQAVDLLLERGNLNLERREFDAAIFDFNVILTQNEEDKRARTALERAMKMKKEATHIDYYAVLGVGKSATATQITRAYKLMVREWHPDRFPDVHKKKEAEETMKKVNMAYDVLRDPRKRRVYDAGAAPEEIDEQARETGFPFDLFGGGEEGGTEGFGSPFDFFENLQGEGVHMEFRFG
jgi:tetratricopeptide (TPR) repeat protein